MTTERTEIGIEVSDVSGQKRALVSELPADATVGELVSGLLEHMELPQNDVSGRPLTYRARLDREGRHLHASEMASDVLEPGDQVVLQPDIEAGGVA